MMLSLDRTGGGDGDIEGSWHGNDTVWRTCLDLQRILHYGTTAGVLDQSRQRQVLSITDAIVAGEGEGPLAPEPVPLGIMSLGSNVAAVEWVHALLMGFAPASLPLLRNFSAHAFPLADFAQAIDVVADGGGVAPGRPAATVRADVPPGPRLARALRARRVVSERTIFRRFFWDLRTMFRGFLWSLWSRKLGPDLAALGEAQAMPPDAIRREMGRRLRDIVRYFGQRDNALPAWREAARMQERSTIFGSSGLRCRC